MGCFVSRVGCIRAHFLRLIKLSVLIHFIVNAFNAPIAQIM